MLQNLKLIQRVFLKVFGDKAPAFTLDPEGDTIIFDSFSIQKTEVEVKSIVGSIKVPSYILFVEEHETETQTEPGFSHSVEISINENHSRIFEFVVQKAVGEFAIMLAKHEIENASIEAYNEQEKKINELLKNEKFPYDE